jgi:hypothetical protein
MTSALLGLGRRRRPRRRLLRNLIWSRRRSLRRYVDPELDARVLIFAFVISILTSVLFDWCPRWPNEGRCRHGDQGSEPRRRRPRRRFGVANLLIVAQVTLSLVALITAPLFLKAAAAHLDPGNTDRVAVMLVSPGQQVRSEHSQQFFRAVERISDAHVRSATWAANLPMFGGNSRSVFIEGHEQDKQMAGILARERIDVPSSKRRAFPSCRAGISPTPTAPTRTRCIINDDGEEVLAE